MVALNVTNWWAERTAADSAGGATAQPIRQPVALKVFDTEETVIVRSRATGSDATGRCSRPS